jgi:hypothetical protein
VEERMEEDCDLDGCLFLSLCVAFVLKYGVIKSRTGYYPRLMLLIPHCILIGIILAMYPSKTSDSQDSETIVPPASPPNPTEDSVAWQSNLRAIQNFMGALYVSFYP